MSNRYILFLENVLASFTCLTKSGFILSRELLDTEIKSSTFQDFEIVLDHQLKTERLILLTKSNKKEISHYINIEDTPDYKFEWLPVLQKAIKVDTCALIYAQNDQLNGIMGFVNCLRREPGLSGVRAVFIQDPDVPEFDPRSEFYAKQLKKAMAVNVYRDGQWGTYRHLLMENNNLRDVQDAYVNITNRGTLSSLRWMENYIPKLPQNNETVVHVYYSALNFRDLMTAIGRVQPDILVKERSEQFCVQGMECSGRLENGTRVFGTMASKGLATTVLVQKKHLLEIPENWSLEDAATVPVIYSTVLYALIYIGKMKENMSLLIHSGAGGVGQAAINLALFYKCTVYTTVSNEEKRAFIKQHWPQIKDNQIGNSHDTSFEEMIMTETQGRGVDFVLNSLAEDKLLASVRCLARKGKFLEIGKVDLSKNSSLAMELFKREASFHGILLDVFITSADFENDIYSQLLKKYIKCGAVLPIHREVFQKYEYEEAFRYLATGKHIGKVLIQIRPEETHKLAKPLPITVKALPEYFPTENGTYIISGGLGGFGLELVDSLILKGARKILLTSRKGITTGYQTMRLEIWKSYGVEIIISTEDITTYSGCKNIVEEATRLGPVEAIFNLAVELRDSLFENLLQNDFNISFNPKVIATKHFDKISRLMCPKLRKFVVFSSISCGRGNAGQTNYGMANSVMERICEQRRKDGYPALAIEWGAVGDVGLVAEMHEEGKELVIGGTLQQGIANCLKTLNEFLCQDEIIVSSMVVAEKKIGFTNKTAVEAVLHILGIKNIKTVNMNIGLAEMGMDSILAVEIKQILERDFDIYLTPQNLRTLTFARLHELETATSDASKPIVEHDFHNNLLQLADEEHLYKSHIITSSLASETSKKRAILLPGYQGLAAMMHNLASNLTVNTICFQYPIGSVFDTIESLAESVLNQTLDYINEGDSDEFAIVGYSYGSLVALELAKLLEERGKIGRLILIDGSPAFIKEYFKEYKTLKEEDLQDAYLQTVVEKYVDEESATMLKNSLAMCKSWNEKLQITITHLEKVTKISRKKYDDAINSFFGRMKSIINYKENNILLKTKIIFVRAKEQIHAHLAYDHGLSKYTEQPVETIELEDTHLGIVDNLKCAEEINKILNKK